jgi:membrane protein YdbS with pleckstrin-like domain
LKVQIVETFATLMTAAFGMVAALAWNEAIKALIARYIDAGDELIPMIIYAVVVTIVAVVCIILIARTLGNMKESLEAEEAAKEQK